MLFESEFFFNGIPRWNLGWVAPNYAGAFIATLLPWFWARRSAWKNGWDCAITILLVTVEFGLWFLLCKTYSRGGVVAALVALGVSFILRWRFSPDTRKESGTLFGLRVATLVLLMAITAFSGRVNVPFLQADKSVANRFDLWAASLEMVAEAPLRGWGAGESGRAFMNWFQELDRLEIYSTTVNSYLHVAVEYGAWAFGLVLACLGGLSCMTLAAAKRSDWLAVTGGLVCATWAVANIFTTLWIEPKLWIVPSIGAGILLLRSAGSIAVLWRRVILWGGVGAVCGCMLLVGLGMWQGHGHKIRITVGPNQTVLLTSAQSNTQESLKRWEAWPDSEVLGDIPGKELRRWLEKQPMGTQLLVHPPLTGIAFSSAAEVEGFMLFGRFASLATEIETHQGAEYWVIHPSVPPPKPGQYSTRPMVTILLPEVDETGLNGEWEAWAEQTHARVSYSPRSGLDIRSVWPEIASTVAQP